MAHILTRHFPKFVSHLNKSVFKILNKRVITPNLACFPCIEQPKFFRTSADMYHGEYERQPPKSEEDVVNIKVVDRDGFEFDIRGKIGDNLLILAQQHEIDIEGACEVSLACSTCHVYVDEDYFDRLDEPCDTEEDLLDTAPFLAENSRLGCQIILRKDLEGMTVRLPIGTRNMRVDQKRSSGPNSDEEAR